MSSFVSLLRGINVSGQKKVKMAELRAMYEGLGLQNVQSYVQSGNVIFSSDLSSLELSEQIKSAIQATFGYDVAVFVYDADEWQAIAAGHPFADNDHKFLYYTFLDAAPQNTEFDDLPLKGEEYVIEGNVIYTHYANGLWPLEDR